MMKLAAVCCTFRRPALLGELIHSFLSQDYPPALRELVILDDAAQYGNQSGLGWRLVSVPSRFATLGEKRNACAALAGPQAEGFLVADDDDIYLPHWFSVQAAALRQSSWSVPSRVLLEHGAGLRAVRNWGTYHGGWAFRRETFARVQGYRALNNGEDQELAGRLRAAGFSAADPCDHGPPFYVYRERTGSYRTSDLDDAGFRLLGHGAAPPAVLRIGWSRPFADLPRAQ